MHGLACPRCFTQLDELRCNACNINFSQLGDVFWLWPDPANALLDWRNRFNYHLAKVEAEQNRAHHDSDKRSKGNSQAYAKALGAYQQQMRHILAELHLGETFAPELHAALKTQLPDHHGLDAYNPNIFRDWVWGQDENNATRDVILESLGEHVADNPDLLVMGAGAGRLTHDLHCALGCKNSWSLDSNPLLASIAARMFKCETLELNEFPLAPISTPVVTHTLSGARTIAPNLRSVCADALTAPFAANSFDVVVTSWLLDILDASFTDVLAHISSLLKPGGIWVTHGSLNFESAQPRERYGPQDLAELAAASGFKVICQNDVDLPYLQSPHSRQRRFELTHTMACAIENPATDRPRTPNWIPEWINDPGLAIPLVPEFQTQITSTRVANFMMGLIDGKRSIGDMAGVMEEQRLMPELDAVAAIRSFLLKMHNEALAQKRKP